MHLPELFVIVNRLKQLLAVFVNRDAQKDKTVIGVILVHIRRQERRKGLAVIIYRIEQLKLELIAFIVYYGDKIVAEIFAYNFVLLCGCAFILPHTEA